MEENIREIIGSLEAQFNGDEKHDLGIVRNYLSSLPHTEENLAVVRGIGAYCTEKFPDSDAVRAAKRLEEQFDFFHDRLDEAQTCLRENKFEEAVGIYRELIGAQQIPAREDGAPVRLALSHPFEEMVYRINFNTTEKIERISALPAFIYHQLGMALFELGRRDEAREAFNCEIELNPIAAAPHFELIQIAKIEKKYDEARSILNKIHHYLFTRHQLARFYREHAFLAMMDEQYDLSANLTYISIDYEDTQPARAMLNSLAKHHADLNKPRSEAAKKRLEGARIPVGPYPPVYETALQIGRETRKTFPQVARMAFSVAYDITHYRPLLGEISSLG